MDGVVWKDRLSSRLQNHNGFFVDGTRVKDRGGGGAEALTESRSEEPEAIGGSVTGLKLHTLGRCHTGKQTLCMLKCSWDVENMVKSAMWY